MVSTWNFLAKQAASFRAIIFRQAADRHPTNWTIVGINDIPAISVLAGQVSTYNVPNHERIPVSIGDVLGIGISGSNDPQIEGDGGDIQTRFWSLPNPSTLVTGKTYYAPELGPNNYSISFSAEVEKLGTL